MHECMQCPAIHYHSRRVRHLARIVQPLVGKHMLDRIGLLVGPVVVVTLNVQHEVLPPEREPGGPDGGVLGPGGIVTPGPTKTVSAALPPPPHTDTRTPKRQQWGKAGQAGNSAVRSTIEQHAAQRQPTPAPGQAACARCRAIRRIIGWAI